MKKKSYIQPVFLLIFLISTLSPPPTNGQVFSPKVLHQGQVDTSNLHALVQGIYRNAGAMTDREKAEAIWRFFLTDGRFVEPGMIYHISGWAYEEPKGEVLDPLKLLNSYGFGLCYHIASLLEASYEAGGFKDARTWYLDGHTVVEVFYDGAYHYFDSDMMGYNTIGEGDVKTLPVASVTQIQNNPSIILDKLLTPDKADPQKVDNPWYPADVRANTMNSLASCFNPSHNRLFPFARYESGHKMEYALRPGERIIRHFKPEEGNLYYLPYKKVPKYKLSSNSLIKSLSSSVQGFENLPYKLFGSEWQEFPTDVPRWGIKVRSGPKSQKDSRQWATGKMEYSPLISDDNAFYYGDGAGFTQNIKSHSGKDGTEKIIPSDSDRSARVTFDVQSPYVIIDAKYSLHIELHNEQQQIIAQTSVDDGKTWEDAASISGPFAGIWKYQPKTRNQSTNGELNAISGTYGYILRLMMIGSSEETPISISKPKIITRFQLNPRTLPKVKPGNNVMTYEPGLMRYWRRQPVIINKIDNFTISAKNYEYIDEGVQGLLIPTNDDTAEFIFELKAPKGQILSGFNAGGRFIDLQNSPLVPDKLSENQDAELRETSLNFTNQSVTNSAEIAWSTSLNNKFQLLWEYGKPDWHDGKQIDRTLRWPEVDLRVDDLPPGTTKIFVRYSLNGIALDDIRLSSLSEYLGKGNEKPLEIIHRWYENGLLKGHRERVERPDLPYRYIIETDASSEITNKSVIFSLEN